MFWWSVGDLFLKVRKNMLASYFLSNEKDRREEAHEIWKKGVILHRNWRRLQKVLGIFVGKSPEQRAARFQHFKKLCRQKTIHNNIKLSRDWKRKTERKLNIAKRLLNNPSRPYMGPKQKENWTTLKKY